MTVACTVKYSSSLIRSNYNPFGMLQIDAYFTIVNPDTTSVTMLILQATGVDILTDVFYFIFSDIFVFSF